MEEKEPHYGEEEGQDPHFGEEEPPEKKTETDDQAAMRPTGSGGSAPPKP